MSGSRPASPTAVAAEKAALRARALAARAALPEAERAAASAAICTSLRELPELRSARVVLGYAAFGHEPVIDAFLARLEEQGRGVLLPWVAGDDLEIGRVRDLATLVAGWRGVREPDPATRRPARADRLEATVVPGVAFDRRGGRLGYGGGHFDRLLARVPPTVPVVGVAFDVQVVEMVPAEPHDRRVDILVTEREVVRPAHPRSPDRPG